MVTDAPEVFSFQNAFRTMKNMTITPLEPLKNTEIMCVTTPSAFPQDAEQIYNTVSAHYPTGNNDIKSSLCPFA